MPAPRRTTADDFPVTPAPDEPGDLHSEPTPAPSNPTGSAPREGSPRRRTGGRATTGGATSPPRSPGGARPTAGPARDLKARLEEMFAGMALVPMATGDAYSAYIISSRSGHLAEAWTDLAKQNPAVKRVLENMLQGGAWGGVVLATGAMVVPILGHYGILPPVDPWAGVYGAPPVPQGTRARPMPPAAPSPDRTSPPNPRRNGAGSPATNGDGAATMTPPIAPNEPPGVVTVAGSSSRATSVPGA